MRKQSLFLKFFTALILFIAVPMIIITGILSYEIAGYSETELSKSAAGKLKVAENMSKLLAENLYKDALELTLDDAINGMAGIKSYDYIFKDTNNIMKVYDMQEALSKLVGTNDTIHSLYLLLDNTDYIMTSNQGVNRLNEFSDVSWLDSYNKLKEFRPGSSWLSTRLVRYSNEAAGEQTAPNKVITFFYTFTPYTTAVKGSLIFNIREEAIRNFANSDSTISEGYIAIINSEGDVISHIQDNFVGRKLEEDYVRQVQESTVNEGYIINNTKQGRQLITYYKSDFNGWIYIGIFQLDVLMTKINTLMMRTTYTSIACLLIGIIISYIISKRISSPLNKLVQEIRARKGIDIKSHGSEMAILSNVFDNMLKEEDRLFSILESNRNNNKNIYLLNLIQGKIDGGLSNELTGLDFIHDQYICAVILIDRFSEFVKAYSYGQRDYMRTLILRVSEQLIGSVYKCAGMIYEKQRIVLVINFEMRPADETEQSLKDIFSKLQEEISKVFEYTISVGIGNCQASPSGITETFDKAQEALKYRLVAGYGSINFWKEENKEDNSYYYPFSKEKQIFNLMNFGIIDGFEKAVSELVQEIRERDLHCENVAQIFNQLAVNTVKYLFDIRLNISMVFGSSYNIYQILSAKETLEDIKIWLIEMFSSITAYLIRTRSQNTSNFDRALDYIHENYKKNIDINSIADSVGLSYSHLRKIFKDEIGDNIVNYINNMRINESKRLLCQTNMTIKDIAHSLGYNNEQSFVRFFKKYESVSPGEFRISNKLLL